MQGGSNVGYAAGAIRRNSVVMLQESGTPGFASNLTPVPGLPNVPSGVVSFGTRHNPADRFVIHHSNGRCSQTVLPDTNLGPVTPFVIPAPSPTLRPIVGGTANSVAFGSFHAPSGNHAAAEGVLGSQLAQASVVHPHLVFGGDANWNILQQQVAGSIQALQPPGATHQSGGQLDGMVCATSVQSTPLINLGMTVVSVA